jgi:hypothetical protein
MEIVLKYVIRPVIVLLPTVGYVDTMRLMVRSRTSAPYNLNTVLILFTGQGLKALYYIYHRFSNIVFGQCVALLVCATALTVLNFCYDALEMLGKPEQFTPTLRPRFLKWLSIWEARSCWRFTAVMVGYAMAVFTVFRCLYVFLGAVMVVNAVGVIANLIEAMVSLPIFVRVVVQRSCANLSIILIFQYILADVMKIGLFLITRVPRSFIFGASCQLGIDLTTVTTYLRLTLGRSIDNAEEEEKSESSSCSLLTTDDNG